TVLLFRHVLTPQDPLSFLDLLLVAASSDDCEPVLTVDFEELDDLASQLARERSFLLRRPQSEIVKLLGVDGKRLLVALKMALVARAWTRLGDLHVVTERHDCYVFEVERLRQSLERLLSIMAAVCNLADNLGEQAAPQDEDMVPLKERVKAL